MSTIAVCGWLTSLSDISLRASGWNYALSKLRTLHIRYNPLHEEACAWREGEVIGLEDLVEKEA